MSTAGKVLTVLILLMTVAWIVMMSAVAQLNVNWQAKLTTQKTEFDRVTDEAEKAKAAYLGFTEQARAEQDATDRDLRVRLAQVASAEARQSSKVEDLTRLKIQLADYLAAVEKAKTNLATREAEKAKDLDDLAKKRDEIAKAQGTNAELRAELAQLQDEFKRLLADNAAKVAEASKAPAAKPASSRRVSPSS